jgi:membrane fusion protein, multidrug efflux system
VKISLRNSLPVVGMVGAIVLTVVGWRYYDYFEHHVSTEDAYVDGSVAVVAPSIAGTVAKVMVEDNQQVRRGDLLIALDPQDYQARLEQAQIDLERAGEATNPLGQLEAADAALKLAGSQLGEARLDFQHARTMRMKSAASREYYDQAAAVLRLALADLALAQRQVQSARADLDHGSEGHSPDDFAVVRRAQAALDRARVDLNQTQIEAPVAGTVVRKNALVGDHVHPGEALMAIIPVDRLYVTANFKETQLTGVRLGQPARITADLYPGYVYRGRVSSISAGTAAAFSVLPPENATGNWIKVVQRVPVKITLDQSPPPDRMLRLGLSVEVTVETDSTGNAPAPTTAPRS